MAGKGTRTHYDNLQVARNASQDVIKAAYRVLSQRYHPDKNIGNPQAEQVMRVINEAYKVLADPQRRARHDKWIADMENRDAPASAEIRHLKAGSISYYHLPINAQKRLQERAKGAIQNQLKVPIGGVTQNYLWIAGLCGWFVMLFVFSHAGPWSAQTTNLLIAVTLFVAIFMGVNAHAVLRWHFSPLKRDLILTPVYFIKMWDDEITYWPIWDLKEIHVTHRYQNGVYAGSDTSLRFPSETVTVTIGSEAGAQQLMDQLQDYEQLVRIAKRQNNVEFFRKEDDFKDLESPPRQKKPWLTSEALAGYGISALAAALLFSIAYNSNIRYLPEQPASLDRVVTDPAPLRRTLFLYQLQLAGPIFHDPEMISILRQHADPLELELRGSALPVSSGIT